jgi:hypothetical protein
MIEPIIAHGPWWSEWHHILNLWPAIVAFGSGIVAWFKVRFMFKDDDNGE